MSNVGGSTIVVHVVARAFYRSRNCGRRVPRDWQRRDSIREYCRLPLQDAIESDLKRSGLEPIDEFSMEVSMGG